MKKYFIILLGAAALILFANDYAVAERIVMYGQYTPRHYTKQAYKSSCNSYSTRTPYDHQCKQGHKSSHNSYSTRTPCDHQCKQGYKSSRNRYSTRTSQHYQNRRRHKSYTCAQSRHKRSERRKNYVRVVRYKTDPGLILYYSIRGIMQNWK